MPTHHDEPLLERYQREHREFERIDMSKAEELANMLDDLYAVDERPIDKETSAELRRLSAINAELLDELATLRSERTAWRVTAENAEAAVKQARIDALEEARKAVDDETFTDPQDASDDAYNAAVYDCVQAIRSLKETP